MLWFDCVCARRGEMTNESSKVTINATAGMYFTGLYLFTRKRYAVMPKTASGMCSFMKNEMIVDMSMSVLFLCRNPSHMRSTTGTMKMSS